MRSAEARLGVVESLDSAMRGVGRTWELISVPRKVARWGVTVGGGLLGVAIFRRLVGLGRRQVAAVPVAPAEPRSAAGSVAQLVLQLLPVVLAPWLRTQMSSGGLGHMLNRFHPGTIFFRWLGLEK